MFEIIKSETFDYWLTLLRNKRAISRINARLRRVTLGNLGDIAPVGDGVSEMRIFYGHGYRVYFITQSHEFIVVLCGGEKASQNKDIKQAKELANEWRV
ncbi:MAG: addiction module antitoxin RelB [Desulfobacteraceae bacterium 4572_35.1]|nr:MAG: addiction module antitoxin RelB [Desulfobacteraceae bacterium 4572_35.1]